MPPFVRIRIGGKMKVKSSVLKDVLEIQDPRTGEIVKSIPFVISITNTAQKVLAKQIDFTKADQNNPAEMGKAYIDLLVAIFGEEFVDEILDYYGEDYYSMVVDLSPVVAEIFPYYEKFRKKALSAKKRVKIH